MTIVRHTSIRDRSEPKMSDMLTLLYRIKAVTHGLPDGETKTLLQMLLGDAIRLERKR